jgi:hypothetical protein
MDIAAYLETISFNYLTGQATEHSYRPALTALFQSIDPALTVINEPKKSEAGMPDFLFQRGDIPFGWAEAKDVNKDVIRLKGYSIEQRKRYEKAYPNLIYTNGVDFEFIRDGEQVHYVSIADFLMGLQPRPERFEELERQLRLFAEAKPISIRSAARLAEMMAAKAAIIKDEIGIALADDPDFRSGLGGQYKSFKANLLPALEPDEFADIYAETITYGMFAARFHDDDLSTFSRQEALEKLPASNPFLKGLFEYIAGPQLPKRLAYIVDDLVQLMRASDPHSLFRDFGRFTARNDPFVHFYEDFLAAYNPKKRKSRGVWYTPEPVVDFIVRAVDDVLKTEFGLPEGLADTSKVTVDWDTGANHPKTGKPVTEKREVHRVQILDPATGTGTFLAKAVQLISDRVNARAPGKWSGYVEQDLLPRLHGFELLMASYAMCHMKLDMMLGQTGYKPTRKAPRLSVWLTNALEPAERDVRDLFFQPLAEEARGASAVKRQTPIMCVIGNPPYSGESANKGDHIMALMEAYKKEPGGKERLKERNPKWINDDYVKFIRMSEDLIARNPSGGVLGFITNHSYLDSRTFRGMRWHLLNTFDSIHILDLHGSLIRQEVNPDGAPDKNVFDIKQGVAIILAVKKGQGCKLSSVKHGDLWGPRAAKSEALFAGSVASSCKTDLPLRPSKYAFVPRDHALEEAYSVGFALNQLFPLNSNGIVTARDGLTIDARRDTLRERLRVFSLGEAEAVRRLFSLGPDVQDWSVVRAQADLGRLNEASFANIAYRPFDVFWTYYTGTSRGLHCRPRADVMSHYVRGPNLGLLASKAHQDKSFAHAFATSTISEAIFLSGTTASNAMNLPLYVYTNDIDESGQRGMEGKMGTSRRLNVDLNLYTAICKAAGIDPADQAGPEDDFRAANRDARPSEVKVFDYVYGVLHTPAYRKAYAEFLKIDFPRIPYPPSPEVFAHVSEKGEQLRRLHLMEAAAIGETPYIFDGEGNDVVASGYPRFEEGKVRINRDQYFANVPKLAWEFHIGGYQPAQKWLKDRRGRPLSYEDVGHYQKIIKILAETDRIMNEIELPLG